MSDIVLPDINQKRGGNTEGYSNRIQMYTSLDARPMGMTSSASMALFNAQRTRSK
jgi:hypothetical protein